MAELSNPLNQRTPQVAIAAPAIPWARVSQMEAARLTASVT